MPDASYQSTAYAALDAFLEEHRLCRSGVCAAPITARLLELWCSCGMRIIVALPPRPTLEPTP